MSTTSPLGQDDLDGFQEELEIEPEAPVVDVVQIEPDDLVEVLNSVAAADLPHPRNARLDADAPAVPVLIMPDFRARGGACSDQAHLPLEDVPELGKFVQTGPAQKFPDQRDPRVVPDFEDGAGHLVPIKKLPFSPFRSGAHGPEFPAAEDAPPLSDPFLGKEYRSRRIEPDCQGDEGEQKPGHQQPHQGANHVQRPLGQQLLGVERFGVVGENRNATMKKTQLPPRLGHLIKIENDAYGDPQLLQILNIGLGIDDKILLETEDDLVHRMLLTCLDEVADMPQDPVSFRTGIRLAAVHLNAADHAQSPVRVILQQLMEAAGLFLATDDQNLPIVVTPPAEVAERHAQGTLLGREEEEREGDEEEKEAAAEEVPVDEEDDGGHHKGAPDVGRQETGEDVEEGQSADRIEEPLPGQEIEPGRQYNEQRPGVVPQREEWRGEMIPDRIGEDESSQDDGRIDRYGQTFEEFCLFPEH